MINRVGLLKYVFRSYLRNEPALNFDILAHLSFLFISTSTNYWKVRLYLIVEGIRIRTIWLHAAISKAVIIISVDECFQSFPTFDLVITSHHSLSRALRVTAFTNIYCASST